MSTGATGDEPTPPLPLQLLDAVQSLYKEYVQPHASPGTIAVIILIIAATNLYLRFARPSGTADSSSDAANKKSSSEPSVVKDIFATLHRGKKGKSSSSGKKDHPTDKPFGSSYYYAHNNPNATGGYRDGLRMEDYEMNGPKLLSKGGQRVEEDDEPAASETAGDDDREIVADPAQASPADAAAADAGGEAAAVRPEIPPGSAPLSRYMWDDEATTSNSSGTAKIYIDTLPNRPSTEPPIQWANAGIAKSDVAADVFGEDGRGLLITVRRPAAQGIEPKSYHLHVPRMYGAAEGVKVIVKSKRLLVKITKKRNRLNIWDKKNLRPWPQLTEKPVGGGSGTDHVDEDMFKRNVDPVGGGMAFDEDLFSKPRKGN